MVGIGLRPDWLQQAADLREKAFGWHRWQELGRTPRAEILEMELLATGKRKGTKTKDGCGFLRLPCCFPKLANIPKTAIGRSFHRPFASHWGVLEQGLGLTPRRSPCRRRFDSQGIGGAGGCSGDARVEVGSERCGPVPCVQEVPFRWEEEASKKCGMSTHTMVCCELLIQYLCWTRRLYFLKVHVSSLRMLLYLLFSAITVGSNQRLSQTLPCASARLCSSAETADEASPDPVSAASKSGGGFLGSFLGLADGFDRWFLSALVAFIAGAASFLKKMTQLAWRGSMVPLLEPVWDPGTGT